MTKDYETIYAQFDEQFKDIKGSTVINTDKLEAYFHDVHTFYLEELQALHARIDELEKKD